MVDDSNIADDDDELLLLLLLLQSLHSCTSDDADSDANADEVVSARRAKVMQADLLDAVERLIVLIMMVLIYILIISI